MSAMKAGAGSGVSIWIIDGLKPLLCLQALCLRLMGKAFRRSLVCLDARAIRHIPFRDVTVTTVLTLSICFGQSITWAYEPVPSGTTFYNHSGVAIPTESLRFANGGWSRGRDQGFAFALQKNTSYFYLWIQTAGGAPLGRHLFCDGKLINGKGESVRVDSVISFTLGDLKGKGSNFLIAVTNDGESLLAWDLSSCNGQGMVRASAELSIPAAGSTSYTIRGDVVAGDFDGTGKELIQTIAPDSGELIQWALDPMGFRLVRRAFLSISPRSTVRIHGIKYVGITRLPHDRDNAAYESATIILHDKGFTLARNDKAIAFAPNCRFQPAVCANKTLVFNLDQGFTDGLQDLARKDRIKAGEALERIITTLHSAQNRFTVWALINPIQEDREATLFILDKLVLAGIPFILDYYSSDITNLTYIKKDWLDYKPRAYAPLKGISLDAAGSATSPDSLDFYSKRYGSKFVGLRQMERLGIDINTKDPNDQPMIADSVLAKRELSFDSQAATRALEWANNSGRYVIWSDPALYVPYECYSSPTSVQADIKTRDDYIEGETKLAARYPNIVPMYDNNEGLKRCGVVYGDWIMTPRNFRLSGWERIPSRIASVKRGSTALTGAKGFGLSVQSWTSDYDPILNAGTLPPEEMVIWTLDGFSKGASIVEFEPYFYLFAWPPSSGLTQSLPPANGQHIGDARIALDVLFSNLGVEVSR
jgi:hypothetical protein